MKVVNSSVEKYGTGRAGRNGERLGVSGEGERVRPGWVW